MQSKRASIAISAALLMPVVLLLWVLTIVAGDIKTDDPSLQQSAAEDSSSGVSILQDRSSNCGPAALQMILRHYGVEVPLRRLERESKTGLKGASMQGLKEAAELHGLHAGGWKFQWDDLRRADFPVILFLREKHFVVVDTVEGKELVRMRDPMRGRTAMTRAELLGRWNGESLVFSRGSANNVMANEGSTQK